MSASQKLLDRRSVLRGAAGLGAAAVLHGTSGGTASAAPTPADVETDPVIHLLKRATYGPTPSLVAYVRQIGIDAWLSEQLQWPDWDSEGIVSTAWSDLWLTPAEVQTAYAVNSPVVMRSLREAHVARAVWSERGLLEVMVDFWSNHLNVPCPFREAWDVRHVYDWEIRSNVFGRFSDLLVTSARSAAMLRYLDNGSSTRVKPNENYARESLELHTVGIDGGYTEQDVKQAALLLTGMIVDKPTGSYRFQAGRHYVGAVEVMDFRHANARAVDGESVATTYLRWLARHPATAHHIAHKLARRFVADAPPAELVTALAQTYLEHDTLIAPVLRQLFTSPQFAASAGQKVRTPFEDVVATVRALGLTPKAGRILQATRAVYNATAAVGQPPLAWSAPNGYPDVAAAWSSSSSTVARWNLHHTAASGGLSPALNYPPPTSWLSGPLPATHGELIDALCERFWLPRRGGDQQAALCAFVDASPETPLTATSEALTSRLPHLAALLLDSPDFFQR
jgi:uncharacterized protein (DUF1800 family)